MEENQGQEVLPQVQEVAKTSVELLSEASRVLKQVVAKRETIQHKITDNAVQTDAAQKDVEAAFDARDLEAAGKATKLVNNLKNALVKLQAELNKANADIVTFATSVKGLAEEIAAE